MATRTEVVAFGCHGDDLAVLAQVLGQRGPMVRAVDSPGELARYGVSQRPLAIVLGIGRRSLSHLDLIPVIRAVKRDLPVIVVADDDSLELERSVRQRAIFYYLVHPIQQSEVQAVVRDLMRYAGG